MRNYQAVLPPEISDDCRRRRHRYHLQYAQETRQAERRPVILCDRRRGRDVAGKLESGDARRRSASRTCRRRGWRDRAPEGFPQQYRRDIYSVHVRTRKFRNPEKTKRYVVPAPRANSKTQGGTRIDSDSICQRHHSVFRVFKRSEYIAQAGITGLVLEFGVRRGTSITHIAEAAGQPVHGFDSFEGLPEKWGSQPQGSFTTELELPPVPGNATLRAGWFEDTLPTFLGEHPGSVRFVNIDCDIYSSTRTVLSALAGRLRPGSILVFDEFIGNQTWREHEYKAFQEFVHGTGVRYEYFAACPFTRQV